MTNCANIKKPYHLEVRIDAEGKIFKISYRHDLLHIARLVQAAELIGADRTHNTPRGSQLPDRTVIYSAPALQIPVVCRKQLHLSTANGPMVTSPSPLPKNMSDQRMLSRGSGNGSSSVESQ